MDRREVHFNERSSVEPPKESLPVLKSKRAAADQKASPSSAVPSVKELQALLRGVGMRSTASRIAVLEHFYEHGGRKSHGDIFAALEGGGFDRATIYRILVDLAEAKILTRTDLGDHVWRFELVREGGKEHGEEHPHFICVDCGQVACLPDVAIKVSARKAPRSVASKKVAIQLKGVCDDCG